MLAVSGQQVTHLWTLHRELGWGAFIRSTKSAYEPVLDRRSDCGNSRSPIVVNGAAIVEPYSTPATWTTPTPRL